MAPHRARWWLALLCSSGLFVFTSPLHAVPESKIRELVSQAEEYVKQPVPNWEKAREIYEALLGQKDPGLKIRERYHHAQRRCWQARRHQDPSYRKEVLSVEYGQALKLSKIVNRTLLDDSVAKTNIDPAKLFHKGIEEFDAALSDPFFLREHLSDSKRAQVAAFRVKLNKTWGNLKNLSREEALKQIGQVALAAEEELGLNATTVVMEFACGACYAIDEYTVYLTPNQLRELAQSLSRSEAIGVGLTLTIRDNKILISDIGMGSPADRSAVISVGDQLITVNKKAVADLPLLAVKELLEGPLGSMLEIELLAPGATNIRMVTLNRERAVVPSIVAFPLPRTSYGYLKINSFTDSTAQDVDKAIAELAKEGMKGLIVDLRDNNGGVFESAIDTARRFLSTGIITSTQHQDAKYNQVYHARNPKALTLPLVVLVDNDTASAAEVLAGALKDNNRAYLIGQTTFGKGCTQCLLKFREATGGVPTGGMRLTVARFFSPKGHPYSGRGVVPHFIIDDAIAQSQSTVMGGLYLDKAVEELNRMTMQK